MKDKLFIFVYFKICIIVLTLFNSDIIYAQGTWIQKVNFQGTARNGAVGFSIGNKGYIGTGATSGNYTRDFWEYDPITDSWMQKADFGGGDRAFAVGFSIGNKGYVGTGYTNEFWEYNPATNLWTQKANVGGGWRGEAVGFSIGNKGYIGAGVDQTPSGFRKDFWEYDTTYNTWTQKADLGGVGRNLAVGFSIKDKGYIGKGYHGGSSFLYDFWEFDPCDNSWTQKTDFPGTNSGGEISFGIDDRGYVGIDADFSGTNNKDFYQYNPSTDIWKKMTDFAGIGRSSAVGFSIGSKGYVGTGYANGIGAFQDLWEFSPCSLTTSVSTQTVRCKGGNDGSATIIVSNGISPYTYLWNTSPVQSSYEATGLLPGKYTFSVIDSIGCETTGSVTIKDTSFSPDLNISFTVNQQIFTAPPFAVMFTNNTPNLSNLIFYWQPGDDTVISSNNSTLFYQYNYNSKYNVALIVQDTNQCRDTLIKPEYIFCVGGNDPPSPNIYIKDSTNFCSGDSVVLTSSQAFSYNWSNGDTTQATVIKSSGNYYVTVSNGAGWSSVSDSVTIIVDTIPHASITTNRPTSVCTCQEISLNAHGGNFYEWSNGSTSQSIIVNKQNLYSVKVIDSNGCVDTASLFITVFLADAPPIPMVTQNGNVYSASLPPGNWNYQWFLNGNSIAGATTPIYTAMVNGAFSLKVSNSYGCFTYSDLIIVSSVEELSESSNFHIYPNPNSGNFNFIIDGIDADKYDIEIVNVLGERVYSSKFQTIKSEDINHLNLDLKSGIYMVLVKSNKYSMYKKFIIE